MSLNKFELFYVPLILVFMLCLVNEKKEKLDL